jgi:hypothetical protein
MWPGGKISKRSLSSFDAFISEVKYIAPTPQNKQIDDKILIHVD